MAYTWTNGELITAAKLNQTGGGGGIFYVGENDSILDKTWAEIYAAMDNNIVIIKSSAVDNISLNYIASAYTDGEAYYITDFWGTVYIATTENDYPVLD